MTRYPASVPCPNCGRTIAVEQSAGGCYSINCVCGLYTLGCGTVAEAWQEVVDGETSVYVMPGADSPLCDQPLHSTEGLL